MCARSLHEHYITVHLLLSTAAVFDQDGTHRPLSGGAIAVIVIVLVIAAAVLIAVMVVAGVVHVMT